ncbi:hypothetical protein DICPUDRAFT_153721 [Dictyostelium purpureum]|uniref:Terpene synthase 3 n=1 Tax=Dictyostelium purpureum TaxID=5786 RepID=TPS3_DICPU|nr:uncharacterized protein DICPUDRAFT_153721 [Dictyostelium purpureum]F0ZPL2.1 RecName: Full=Terpene synthase 3 [Dictyostelium purpureum]AXN72972.1 terpene synthase [Dictyostelium purpureum]EGC34105.1 hypothetical protein DICPUDRAFT_153721 [Dictyostelium purpureum]|eukprot:XP_003289351.1 hypothetical protein DICPUDRAFT_153721 [Dictyostelium purpureum]
MQKEIYYTFDINNIKDKEFTKVFVDCPWEAIRNPTPIDESEHLQWLKDSNLFDCDQDAENFFKDKTYIMSSYINPLNPKDNIIWVIRMHDFIYIVDDFYFEKGLLGEEWVINMFDRDAPQDKIGKTFWNIIEGMEKTGNKKAVEQLLHDTKIWALSVFTYNKCNINSESSFEYYCKYRCLDVGMDFGLSTAKVFAEPLPKEVLESSTYKRIIFGYNQTHSLINDMVSFERERKESNRMANYVMVHAYKTNSVQESMYHCKQMVEGVFNEINVLCEQLKREFPDVSNLDFHLNLIKLVISGDNYVSNDTTYPRYNLNH